MKKVFSLFALLMVINLFAQENKLDTDREVQACNLVTQYLCILEDLQGRGYVRVRKELQENIKRLVNFMNFARSFFQRKNPFLPSSIHLHS